MDDLRICAGASLAGVFYSIGKSVCEIKTLRADHSAAEWISALRMLSNTGIQTYYNAVKRRAVYIP